MESIKPTDRNRQAPADHDFSLLGVLRTLWQWRRPIIMTTAAAFVGAIVISLLLSNYYMAETRFLALSPDQATPQALFNKTGTRTALYGNMNDIDRMLAIAESHELVDYLVQEFNLYDHYDIDTTSSKASTKVRSHFFSLYEVTKTPRDAILIQVEDKDPEFAAALANAARERIDHISRELIRTAQRKTIDVLRSEIDRKSSNLTNYGDSLRGLREIYQIYDLNTQMELLSTKSNQVNQGIVSTQAQIAAYRNSNIRGKNDSIAKLNVKLLSMGQLKSTLDSQLVLLNRGMEPMLNLLESRASTSKGFNDDFERLRQYESALNSDQRSIAVLETASVPVIKSRPKRSIIVLGATFLAFLLAVLAALAIENGRQYDWKQITDR